MLSKCQWASSGTQLLVMNSNPQMTFLLDSEELLPCDLKLPQCVLSCFAFLQQKVVFCSVKEALEVDWGSDNAAAALKRTAPDYFLLQGEASALLLGAGHFDACGYGCRVQRFLGLS